MPKGQGYGSYSTGTRQGQKAGSGYPGRGAAGMPNDSSSKQRRAEGYDGKTGTHTQVMVVHEMRPDMTAGIMQANPYPGKRGGNYSGPGRS